MATFCLKSLGSIEWLRTQIAIDATTLARVLSPISRIWKAESFCQ